MKTSSTILYLQCSYCNEKFDHNKAWNVCTKCNKSLYCVYDLQEAKKTMTKEELKKRSLSMWRYEEVLPVLLKDSIATVSFTEGWTPLIHAKKLGEKLNCPNTYIKDESRNPTFSFKARGLSMCVSKCYELGIKEVAIPSAGNAAGALSCYGALKGLKVNVFMPKDVDIMFQLECKAFGANITLVDGYISDCGAKVREGIPKNGWFEVSTMREPYRVEGKKTMGYEIVEQLDWKVPDVIVYATGGGTGLIGMWKAFSEMEELGLIDSKRPRLVSVQSTGCYPIVQAFENGAEFAKKWENAKTLASGLRVPVAAADYLILRALRESNGIAVTVTDEEMLQSCIEMGRETGILPAPEGGACLKAQQKLLEEGWIKPTETVVLFNTGSLYKYSEAFKSIKL